jgi:type I restriction-modification system DNA methylase subunit
MNLSSFIWSVADLLRGKYKPHEYGRVILPFTVLRRMDCVLAPTKAAVLAEIGKHRGSEFNAEHFLRRAGKRRELSDEQIAEITQIFGRFEEVRRGEVPISLIFPNESFGYRTITVERPLRDESGEIVCGTKGKTKGKPLPDPELRDTENVPLGEDVEEYFGREVLPHASDAWIDHEKTKIGYEIPFNRHFYVFKPPRDLAAIDADLKVVTANIQRMLAELSA